MISQNSSSKLIYVLKLELAIVVEAPCLFCLLHLSKKEVAEERAICLFPILGF